MSITESVGVASAYHRLITTNLTERARQRSAKISDFDELLKAEDFTAKEQSKKEIANAVEKDKIEQQSPKEDRLRKTVNTKDPS